MAIDYLAFAFHGPKFVNVSDLTCRNDPASPKLAGEPWGAMVLLTSRCAVGSVEYTLWGSGSGQSMDFAVARW